jgi:hypothetical protein
MTRHRKWPFGLAVLTLLSGCSTAFPVPAANDAKVRQQAYWAGYAAGRRYQKQQDAQTIPAAPNPAVAVAPVVSIPPVSLAPAAPPAPAPVVVQPAPPPTESYAAKGPAKPVATPAN